MNTSDLKTDIINRITEELDYLTKIKPDKAVVKAGVIAWDNDSIEEWIKELAEQCLDGHTEIVERMTTAKMVELIAEYNKMMLG